MSPQKPTNFVPRVVSGNTARLHERVPPHDLDAEAAVLSALLLEEGVAPRVRSICPPEAFYSPANRRIAQACLSLLDSGSPLDTVTVAAWLKERDRLHEVGGVPYLANLIDAVPFVANIEAYAYIVRERWRTREAISLAHRIAAEGYGEVEDRAEWLRALPTTFLDLARDTRGRGARPIGDVAVEVFKQMQRAAENGGPVDVISTGFKHLDHLIGGFGKGELLVLGGRPGMGKSALLGNLCLNAARAGEAALLISLEMNDAAIVRRMVCGESRVPLRAVKTGQANEAEWSRFVHSVAGLSGVPLSIYDTPCSLSDIQALVHAHAAELHAKGQRLGIVAIDYMQLTEVLARKNGNREQEIAQIARGLKLLAKEHDLCVIGLSQLNRDCDKRDDKRPSLGDLRESGAIEQDADVVLFVYRDEQYGEKHDGDDRTCTHVGPICNAGRCEVIVAKQRDGPVGTVVLRFDAENVTFHDAPGAWMIDTGAGR